MSGISPTGDNWFSKMVTDFFGKPKAKSVEEYTKEKHEFHVAKQTVAEAPKASQMPEEIPEETDSSYDSYDYEEEESQEMTNTEEASVAPRKKKKQTISTKEGFHKVKSGETLYRIANNYGISISELLKENPNLKTDKSGNKIINEGTFLKIPEKAILATKTEKVDNGQHFGSWKIEKSKGAFSIMSKFNLYKEELQALNKDIDLENIKANQEFKVPGYKVKSGDTLKKIAKEHDITEKMLKELNPNLKGLKVGSIINVPKKLGEDLGLGELEIEIEEVIVEHNETHTIEKGENLYRIAKKYNVPVWALMLTNKIKDAQKIAIGQELEIPSKEEIQELEKSKKASPKPSAEQTKTHKVRKNEVLSIIAEKYNVPAWAIAAKNNIENPNSLSIGDVLKIPTKDEIQNLEQTNNQNKITPKVKTKLSKIKIHTKKQKDTNYGTISPRIGVITHRVRPKDTVSSIAKEYGVDVIDLKTYNKLDGISLVIPLAKQKVTTLKIVGNTAAVRAVTGISQDFIDNLTAFEDKKRSLYELRKGSKSVGIGHNTTAHRDMHKYVGKTLNDTQIYSLLARDILDVQASAKRDLKDSFYDLSGKQKEALYSLMFNVGSLQASPKLLRAIKKKDYVTAAQQFDHIVSNIDGKKGVVSGLAKRRLSELALFVEGSNMSQREIRKVMVKAQDIYDRGYMNLKNKNARVDYNAYAKKFLGEYIDKGYIKLRG